MTSSERHHRAQLLEAVRIYKELTSSEVMGGGGRRPGRVVHLLPSPSSTLSSTQFSSLLPWSLCSAL
eukprot:747990-Hanusia_phi.AAC.1